MTYKILLGAVLAFAFSGAVTASACECMKGGKNKGAKTECGCAHHEGGKGCGCGKHKQWKKGMNCSEKEEAQAPLAAPTPAPTAEVRRKAAWDA